MAAKPQTGNREPPRAERPSSYSVCPRAKPHEGVLAASGPVERALPRGPPQVHSQVSTPAQQKRGIGRTAADPLAPLPVRANIPCAVGSPAIASDGTVIVTRGTFVTALRGSAALASSDWPRALNGNQNTGSADE